MKKLFTSILVFLLVFSMTFSAFAVEVGKYLSTSSQTSALKAVEFKTQNAKVLGRTNPSYPFLIGYHSSGVEFTVTGTKTVGVRLQSYADWRHWAQELYFELNGKQVTVPNGTTTTKGTYDYIIATNLDPNKVHKVKITMDNENWGQYWQRGFYFTHALVDNSSAQVNKTPNGNHKIIFYGDSITSASGIGGTHLSYHQLMAKNFNADSQVISASGGLMSSTYKNADGTLVTSQIRIARDWNAVAWKDTWIGETNDVDADAMQKMADANRDGIRDSYETNPKNPNFPADLIVINIGTNDAEYLYGTKGGSYNAENRQNFKTEFFKMLDDIYGLNGGKGYYPNATVMLTYGLMFNWDTVIAFYKDLVNEYLNANPSLKGNGTTTKDKVTTFWYTPCASTCGAIGERWDSNTNQYVNDSHPNTASHAYAAEELTQFVENYMGWARVNEKTYPCEKDSLTIYPEYPEMLPRDYDYEVTLSQGDKTVTIPVYNAARKSDSFAGTPNNFRRFCEFAFTGEVTVKVTPRFRIHAFEVLPSSKAIPSQMVNGAITFTIDKPQNLLVRVNDDKNTILSIFAESPETNVPSDNDPNVIYFKAGLNNTNDTYTMSSSGRFYVPEGKTVYLEPGALVTLRPFLRASNVTIKGRGAFIDPQTTRYSDWAFMATINDNINAEKGNRLDNVTFEGIKILDANAFNICIRYADNLVIDDVKVLSNQISTDGISMWGGTGAITNVTVKNCYLFNNDDMLVMSKIGSVTIKDCIFANAHRFLITQNDIDTLLIENADIFGLETLVRATGQSEANSWKNIILRNVFVEDALSLNNVINVQNGTSNPKNMVLENVSLPATFNNGIFINNAQGVNLTLNNVYVGGNPVTSLASFPKSHVCAGNTVTFGTSFDKNTAKANYRSAARKTCNWQGTTRTKVGTFQLTPSKAIPFTQNGVIYVPAIDVLNALGFNVNYEDNLLTFTKGDIYTIKMGESAFYKNGQKIKSDKLLISNDCVMLPSTLLEKIGHPTQMKDGAVQVADVVTGENIIKQGGFETAYSPFANYKETVHYLYSTNWSSFNFGSTYITSDEKYSGKYSALVTRNLTTTAEHSGISQVLTPAIRKYGAGVYRLEFYAKLDPTITPENPDIFAGIVRGSWRIQEGGVPLDINDYKRFTLTNEWQKFTYDMVISDTTLAGYGNAFLFIGAAQEKANGSSATMKFYLDDVSVNYCQGVTSSTLSNVVAKSPTRDGELFKGWYDNLGNLYTKNSTVNGTVYLHPEFVKINGIDGDVTVEKVLNISGNSYHPSECRLGIHAVLNGKLEYNIIDSGANQTIKANADLKNGKVTLTNATTYYSQARKHTNGVWQSGEIFKAFTVKAAPNGYTPKTVALDYDKTKKLFYLPNGITLYVGDTVLFDVANQITDPCPPQADAMYTNGLHIQGAQVRIGGTQTTGLRFVTVYSTDIYNNLKANGFTNVTFGTIVSKGAGYTGMHKLTFEDVNLNYASNVVGEKIFLTTAQTNTNYQKYTACVINIPKASVKVKIHARPYIKYTDLSGTEHILYGEQYTTTIYDVAQSAYNSNDETQAVKDLLYKEILK